MDIAGWIALVFVGVSLGLLGGGGSILTVPILVYLFHLEPVRATSYSLFLVGVTSLVGAGAYLLRRELSGPALLLFGLPSVLGVLAGRRFILPLLPNELPFGLAKGTALLFFLAMLMLVVGVRMIRSAREDVESAGLQPTRLIVSGAAVGLIAGLAGAGGGFLIVPALTLFAGLSIKAAIGSSLTIIAVQSLVGFAGDPHSNSSDWRFLLMASAIALVGLLLGTAVSKSVDGTSLKPAFGWLTLAMALFILVRETWPLM